MPAGYRKVSDLPALIPVFPLDGALLLPGCQLPLQIFEPRYLNMVDDAMSGGRIIGMIQTAAGGDRARPNLAEVGCAGRVTAYAETGDGRYMITLTGICRFGCGEELAAPTPYRQVRPDFERFARDLEAESQDVVLDRAAFLAVLRRYLDHKGLAVEWEAARQAPAGALINSLAMGLPLDPPEKQALLEAATLADRYRVLAALLEIDAAADDDEPPPLQ
ncbi:MAG TPA: LON peptidase substrate-binding domain-containing protein [Caulobacteraceae bacterium]|nr:LON peptidase substrate-binding domain-containing protein [Caulobacteraceae bacterium]